MTKAIDQTTSIQPVEPLLALFAFLVSLREELRAERQRKLQRYADENGLILISVDGGRDFRFLKRRPYSAADDAARAAAIAAEPDVDDWTELKVLYAAQQRCRAAKRGLRQ
jgi:hypothetical protein